MHVAVTGARGYVGSRVAGRLRADGHEVRELVRPEFALERGPADDALAGVDGLVHCAWDFGARTRDEIWRVNVAGSKRLLGAAAGAGARIVFVSTLSAFPGCRSLYGEAKLEVERHALALGGAVVRPGLVWGPQPEGLYGALVRLASLPVLPSIVGAKALHLAHEDDLAALVVHLLENPTASGAIVAAAPEPLGLGEILQRVAHAHARRVRLVPVPWRLPWTALRGLELVGLRPRFRSDSLVSLVSLDERPFAAAAAPPLPFRAFAPEAP